MHAWTQVPPAPNLFRTLGYPKFAREHQRVVVIDSGYHLQRECALSLRQLGHTVRIVPMRTDQPFASILQALLQALVAFKPDFVLSVNHLGFDRDGAMAALFEDIQMPLAVWYVDSPFFVLRSSRLPAPAVSTFFVWDEAYRAALMQAGALDVHYLPLAADSRMLKPCLPQTSPNLPCLFVGDSMQHAIHKWQARLELRARTSSERLSRALLVDRAALVQMMSSTNTCRDARWDILALATFRATGTYRKQVLQALDMHTLHIAGDAGWRDLLPNARLEPAVAYGPDLAACFAHTEININATSLQMPTAVNQRVFDVPAAGGFLITDVQADVHRHIELPQDPVLFTSPAHARELVDFYSKRPQLRQRIAADIHSQVIARHTYVHRLRLLITLMQRRHASAIRGVKEPSSCPHPSP